MTFAGQGGAAGGAGGPGVDCPMKVGGVGVGTASAAVAVRRGPIGGTGGIGADCGAGGCVSPGVVVLVVIGC